MFMMLKVYVTFKNSVSAIGFNLLYNLLDVVFAQCLFLCTITDALLYNLVVDHNQKINTILVVVSYPNCRAMCETKA